MKATIYHVYDKERFEHHYFGSIVAIFTQFSQEEINASPSKLYKHRFDIEPFENEFVSIRKGEVVRSKQMPM